MNLLITDTTIVTCDAGRHIMRGAIAINGDRIAAVGPSADLEQAYPGFDRMAGRSLAMHVNFFWQLFRYGPALAEEVAHRLRVEEIIDFLEIAHIRKVQVGRLPYGLQKRVELGRELAMEPELLLLDEPMAGMNLEEKEDMSRFIIDVNNQFGTTIALIEHDMGVVMDLSDRVVVLDYGRKIADGTPEQIKSNQAVIDAYLGVAR